MKPRALQLHRAHRLALYIVSLALLLSGLVWAWIQRLDELGQASDSLVRAKTSLIAIHGFSAMAFVLLLGTLLVSHIRRAWLGRKNRPNGVFFLAAVSLLVLSGYGLYYVGNETVRAATSQFHLWLGAAAPALLFWHIWAGRKAAIEKRKAPANRSPANLSYSEAGTRMARFLARGDTPCAPGARGADAAGTE
jgi:hypothetical protein